MVKLADFENILSKKFKNKRSGNHILIFGSTFAIIALIIFGKHAIQWRTKSVRNYSAVLAVHVLTECLFEIILNFNLLFVSHSN
jgi:hypothetical protein